MEVRSGSLSKPPRSGSTRHDDTLRATTSACASHPLVRRSRNMQLSARNQLKGQVIRVKSGTVMAEVEVKVKAGKVVAAITAGHLQAVKIQAGAKGNLLHNATEVLIGK